MYKSCLNLVHYEAVLFSTAQKERQDNMCTRVFSLSSHLIGKCSKRKEFAPEEYDQLLHPKRAQKIGKLQGK